MVYNKILASFLLAAAGDAIGFKNGEWEFTYRGDVIMEDLNVIYGGKISNIKVKDLKVSDDTIMHMATARALISWCQQENLTLDFLMKLMADEYIECFDDMVGRSPGTTCALGASMLIRKAWNEIPFDERGGGSGAAMRAMCIGLFFANLEKEYEQDMLIKVSIESGRLTHNHPVGFLGSLASALFTAFAFNSIPIVQWGYLFINKYIPLAVKYLRDESKRDWSEIENSIPLFTNKFQKYLELRGISSGSENVKPSFPNLYGVQERDEEYKKWSFEGWAGASGDDSILIAYDSLLYSKENWEELMLHSAIHGGDSDTTATIAGCWYGAFYGMNETVHPNNYEEIEKFQQLKDLSTAFWEVHQAKIK